MGGERSTEEMVPHKVERIFKTRLSYNCAHLRSTKESLTFFILTLGGTGWYLVVLGQYRTVGVDI